MLGRVRLVVTLLVFSYVTIRRDTMTRKDYEQAARLCAKMLDEGFGSSMLEFARRFFSQDNPRFRAELFNKAVKEEFLKLESGKEK